MPLDQTLDALKLFAVYLGGRAERANTELHDVVFVVGKTIEDTYQDLLEKWFGSPAGLHLDSWIELRVVDGHRISLRREPSAASEKLYFINLGAYVPGEFTEAHANAFLVAASEREVKTRAKERLLRGLETVHTDNLYEVDDCLPIDTVGDFYVWLEPTDEPETLTPVNGYHLVPKELAAAFQRKPPAAKKITSSV